jgi:hypothetical protein
MKKQLCAFLLAIAVTLMGGGAQSASGTPSQSRGGLTAVLDISPQPLFAMEPVSLLLTLSDESGHPITGAEITYDLTMPEMPMPLNRPTVTEKAAGQYLSHAIFTMAGKWHINITVNINGKKSVFIFKTFAH